MGITAKKPMIMSKAKTKTKKTRKEGTVL